MNWLRINFFVYDKKQLAEFCAGLKPGEVVFIELKDWSVYYARFVELTTNLNKIYSYLGLGYTAEDCVKKKRTGWYQVETYSWSVRHSKIKAIRKHETAQVKV